MTLLKRRFDQRAGQLTRCSTGRFSRAGEQPQRSATGLRHSVASPVEYVGVDHRGADAQVARSCCQPRSIDARIGTAGEKEA